MARPQIHGVCGLRTQGFELGDAQSGLGQVLHFQSHAISLGGHVARDKTLDRGNRPLASQYGVLRGR